MPIQPRKQMIAIAISRVGGPEVLAQVERPIPQPGPDEVLIAVEAAGINNSDLMQRRGDSPSTIVRPDVPGLEVAGRVAALGSRARGLTIGQQVCALTNGGGYATHCVAPVAQVLPLPKGCSAIEAAALPEALFTVWSNLFDSARLQDGETLLVHGGASGIGTIAIQMARAFGARIFATAGTPEKCTACEALGAERAINYRTQDFGSELLRLTEGRGADVIFDMVGGDYVMRNITSLAHGGRIVNIAFPMGAQVEVDFMELMRRGGSIAATMLRPRSTEEKGQIARKLLSEVWPLLDGGRIRPIVAAIFPLSAAADAHREFEAGRHIGKLVLDVRAGE
jgi:NADPH:quinone reductase